MKKTIALALFIIGYITLNAQEDIINTSLDEALKTPGPVNTWIKPTASYVGLGKRDTEIADYTESLSDIYDLHSKMINVNSRSNNSEYSDTTTRNREFINAQYHQDEDLPHSIILYFVKEQVELFEPNVEWAGGPPTYKVQFEKVILNNVSMVFFTIPEEDWNEGNVGQLCWVLPIYNPKVIYQINTSYIADNETLKLTSKYNLSNVNDEKLKEWLSGIDLKKEPFKNIAGIETISSKGKYCIVEFNLKQD